jgi:probable F420-dependent oxidoreductase
MQLGFSSMNTPEEHAPDELARLLEERGFDSFWVGEHTHIPTSRKTPYPAGGDLPPQYVRMMDPYVSLMAAAAATSSLLIGTSVALPLEHDVITLAKTVATLDTFSHGRFQFGVGVGWNQEELANHRPEPWSQRYRVLEECVSALRALWCQEESEFHGDYFDFDPVWSQPKPVQKPHPPVLCGTGGKLGTVHAVEWADAWMPIDIALGDVAKKIGRFRQAATEAGRGELPITIVAFGDPTVETLVRYRDLGVERVVLGPARYDWDNPATTVPFIDRYARLIPALTSAS